ncbi:MAG TPA: efflux transporter outer membrane subunit [Candidatus Eisenbacteria bacterium]|nr:efflux transporter outer membrane subunit [Candidatus Eisenbacteria bacterium]
MTSWGVRAAVAALLSLTGCAPVTAPHGFLGRLWNIEVGPDYQRPQANTPANFRGRIEPADAASFADLPWWQVFGDPVLQALVHRVLEGNYDLQSAVASVEQARAQVGVAASAFHPQVGYQGSAERQRTSVPSATFNLFMGAFNLSWEIDVWGRIRRSTEQARAQFLASEEAQSGVIVTLVSEAATDYFQLLELDRELAIARESAETYRHTLDVFTARYLGGTDTKISTSRADANLQSSLAQIAALQRQITEQEDVISALLGTNPGPIDRGMPLVDETTPATPPGLTADLLRRRPDIRQAEQNMIAANAAIGVAVANFFPTVGLSALYGGESPKIGNVVKNGASIWNIAANVTGPVFQGGELLESYYAQQAFWDQTIAQYRATLVEAFREVADALAAEGRLAEERTAQERQVTALREAAELSLASYAAGTSNYLDVLDAMQQLYPAEVALAQTRRDQLLAVVNLYKALGGGWERP